VINDFRLILISMLFGVPAASPSICKWAPSKFSMIMDFALSTLTNLD